MRYYIRDIETKLYVKTLNVHNDHTVYVYVSRASDADYYTNIVEISLVLQQEINCECISSSEVLWEDLELM